MSMTQQQAAEHLTHYVADFVCSTRLQDLPQFAQVAGKARDALLVRVIGSPDPYGKQTDGMGGATSSTSKVVIIGRSSVPGHDVDYLYGQVPVDGDFIDWSGNCGNLSSAVGPFAIANGLIDASYEAKRAMKTDDALWQRLRPKMDAESDSLFEILKAGYREGIPEGYSEADVEAATEAFALMRDIDKAAVGGLDSLPAGTFWPSYRP